MASITIRSAATWLRRHRQATTRSAAGEVRQLGGGAREKLLQATENRTQYQLEASQQPAPTYYHGANRVKPLGANNAIRPRGFQANAPLGQGDRVTDQGGLIQATPRSNQGGDPALRNQVDQHGRLLAKLTPPIQTGQGNPNETESEPGVLTYSGRFDGDFYLDTDSGTFWRWDNSVPEWLPVQIEDLHGEIEATKNRTYTLITSASYAVKVVSLETGGSSAATATLSPAVGSTLAIGDSLGLVVTGGDDADLSFTVKLARA